MGKAIIQFFKDWMLPIAIICGISLYLIYHFTPALRPIGPVCSTITDKGQQISITLMLFLQFVKVSPRDMRTHRWHVYLLFFQAFSFIALAFAAAMTPDQDVKILLESAMLCFICPTASAAGVITDKLGGNLAEIMAYVALVNAMSTFLIPAVVPLVHPTSLSFMESVFLIAKKIFPMLLMPCLAAWLIRYTLPRLQAFLSRYTWMAFYIWGVSLTLSMILATKALVCSELSWITILLIAVVSFSSCFIQFAVGHRIGSRFGEVRRITAGQSLGQKNTGFIIWLGYNFLTPVTSIAGGLYAIAHNLVNSEELYKKRHSPSGR